MSTSTCIGPTRAMRLASAQVDRARREYQRDPSFSRYKAFAAALERQTAVMRQADAARRLALADREGRERDAFEMGVADRFE
jgi:hypothetical protein